jgi:hypothetical protein
MSLAVTIGKAALAQVTKILGRYEQKNTAALIAAWDEAKEEWLVELRRLLPDVLRRLESIEQLQEKLQERSEDPQFQRLLDNVSIEASREAIDERRRMLAHVGAGLFDPSMAIAEAARCERVIRELCPGDILALRRLNGWQEVIVGTRFDQVAGDRPDHLDVLIASGCVAEVPGDNLGGEQTVRHRVTHTGSRILKLLATYEPRGT